MYKEMPSSCRENFYQFALNHKDVADDFRKAGFSLIRVFPQSGVCGTLQEDRCMNNRPQHFMPTLKRNKRMYSAVKRAYNWISRNMFPFAAHSIIMIMRKDAK